MFLVFLMKIRSERKKIKLDHDEKKQTMSKARPFYNLSIHAKKVTSISEEN